LFVVVICFWFRAKNHGLWRQILYKTHLWLGIVSGIILFVICLTGILLVFRLETIMFFEHDKYFVSQLDKLPLNMDDLITKIEQNINGKVTIIVSFNNRKDRSYLVNVKTEIGNNSGHKHNFKNEYYLIDPYTGKTLGKHSSPLSDFFRIVTTIHRSLLLKRSFGRIVVGSATLIFVIVSLSGLFLWLPANLQNKKAWKNSFIIRFREGKKQLIVDDFHKTLGFYVLIPVLAMALTGLAWSFKWYSNGVQMIFREQPFRIVNERPIKSPSKNQNTKRLPLEFFSKKADELITHKGLRFFHIPEYKDNSIIITEKQYRTVGLTTTDKIQFDQYTGEVLQFDRFDDLHIGGKIVSLFYQIHTGEILGLPTKIIYFLACLIATTLPITGTIIWLRKLRHLRKTKNKTNDKLNAA
jgi:uncharacterized iron-regulated membrane protein